MCKERFIFNILSYIYFFRGHLGKLLYSIKNLDKNVFEFHIAHNEGNYFCTNDQLKEIEDNKQIAIYYCDNEGQTEEKFNPNGSIKNIAGIFNKGKLLRV